MEIFKELSKKGYKHYYEGTIEELDLMDKNNSDLHSEIMQVIMWLYEKHGIWISVFSTDDISMFSYKISSTQGHNYSPNFNSPTEAYEAAIEYTLKNLLP